MKTILAITTLLLLSTSFVAAARATPPLHNTSDGVYKWTRQPFSHFTWTDRTFEQRYYVYDKYIDKRASNTPLFFYTGNEADVSLFVDLVAQPFIFAQKMNALVVFAEHRFFGKTQPCFGGFKECGDFLSTDEALADYAQLIRKIRSCPTCDEYYPNIGASVVWGGSYGGMLAAMARMRYPTMVAGAIASSAPLGCLDADYVTDSYWRVVTRDATAAGGAAHGCHLRVNDALTTAMDMLRSNNRTQQQQVVEAFSLCSIPKKVEDLGMFVMAQFDSAAMGSYPMPSWYIIGEKGHPAPPYPMRVMCNLVMQQGNIKDSNFSKMQGLARGLAVVANVTKSVRCFDVNNFGKSVTSPTWDYLDCTSIINPAGVPLNEIPYFAASGAPNDMFYKQPQWNKDMALAYCVSKYGKIPRFNHWSVSLNTEQVKQSSNIFLANGELDPWHSGGILQNITGNPSVVAAMIGNAGHHLDLFAPDAAQEKETPDVFWVREAQFNSVKKWVSEYNAAQQKDKKKHIFNDL